MLKKGETVQVWNRTAARATALEPFGAKAFTDAADAVRGADVVHLVVKDDAAVDEVLAKAAPGLQSGAIIIDHTTTTTEGAVARTKSWKDRGFIYLHAPVFMGPANAADSTGFMLVSGDQDVVTRLEPQLAKMTGKVLNFGAEEGRAASMKLLGNAFLVTLTAGLADTLMLAKALQVPLDDLSTLFSAWNPGTMLQARMQRMSKGNYDDPSWELNMARKDTGLFIKAAEAAGTPLAVIPSIAKEMDKWIGRGHGTNDWTVIGKDAVS
ncbi:NAD(P)-binding domain-containing protein [Chitinophaga sedimenti]|uniref:NAD(P)-dependent oxidoreductase n=1 Tax=Chitinophaga sedimenti TaxID=2033606 RepID=UPI0020030E2C|nr:NAD(P)-binding domain-containing protein [Chitinophaga sedimenti]MCK7557951.1 NAD(P)-binding domain-containing protein [Chitinophaga sedimenti]